MRQALVSVIIPSYNKSAYTLRCVRSVLAQDYPFIEVIVVDDGSKDDTQEVLAVVKDKIQLVIKPNGGACSARNWGIRHAKGEYIAFLDCDDLYLPNKISQAIKYFDRFVDIGFIHTAASFIDKDDKVVGFYDHPVSRLGVVNIGRLIQGNHICNSTVVVRADVLKKVGFFDETIFTPGDWDMWIRLAVLTKGGYIPEQLTAYRIVDNYIFNRLEQAKQEEAYVLDKFFKQYPNKWLLKQQSLSQYYKRFALASLVKNDLKQYWQNIIKSIGIFPLNLKSWAILFGYIILPNHVKRECQRRILRS